MRSQQSQRPLFQLEIQKENKIDINNNNIKPRIRFKVNIYVIKGIRIIIKCLLQPNFCKLFVSKFLHNFWWALATFHVAYT